MTYEEQLQIQELNKQIIDKLLTTYSHEEINEYYFNHTQKESLDHFGLRTIKQLNKLLKLTGYDFSQTKPSAFKGKKSARSHESYIAGGKKSAETQKLAWANKTEEERQAYSELQKEAHASAAFKEAIIKINKDRFENMSDEERAEYAKIRSDANKARWANDRNSILEKTKQTNLERYGAENYTQTEDYHKIIMSEENLTQRNIKTYNTKKQNNSFSCSTPEEKYYEYLCNKYGINDVVRQYRDDIRYPFNCDFYIKSEDLFIELNFTWSHGGHLFDDNNEADIIKLKSWEEKAVNSEYYRNAVNVWTVKDPLKVKTAKQHNLNYVVYYSEEELYD